MTIGEFLRARVPALAWLPAYDRSWLRADAVAGVTTASVIIPKAMAYAALAGLAVQVGLYTALLPMAVYAVLGSSLRLSVSTTTTIGILTAAEISHIAPGAPADQAATIATSLALLVGLILVLAAVFRLGFVAQFISEPVLTGFKAGIGLVIIVDQAPKLFGLHVPKGTVLQHGRGAGGGPAALVTAHTHLVGRDDRADAAARPVRAACARAAARRGARHRGIGAHGPEGGRGGHDRYDPPGPAGCHAP